MKKKILSISLIMIFCMSFTNIVWAKSFVANDFTKETAKNQTLNFSRRDFLNAVNPPSGYKLTAIRLTQLTNPSAGILRIGTKSAELNSTISLSKLDKLNFIPTKDYSGEAIFTWYAVFGRVSSPYPGAVILTVGGKANNNAPSAQNTEIPQEKPKPERSEQKKPAATALPTAVPTNSPTAAPTAEPKPTAVPQYALKPLKYDDMDNHWAAYSAGLLAAKGYVIGEEVGDRFFFHPDKVMSRFDFLLMVNSIFGVKAKDSTAKNPFADNGVPDYILRHAIASYEEKIITGSLLGNKLYLNPYEKITRAEAIKILDNALKLKHKTKKDAGFNDSVNIPKWSCEAINNLEAYGIIRGFSDNTIRPNECITKAESAEMVYQTLKYLEKMRKTKSVFNFVKI